MERKRGRPWRMLAPLIAVIVLAVLWSVYWTVVSAAIKDGYAEAEQDLAQRGISLNCEAGEWGGFPFRVERNCAAPRLSITDPQMDISASHLLLAVQAYNPRHAIALVDGPTTIRGADSRRDQPRARTGEPQVFRRGQLAGIARTAETRRSGDRQGRSACSSMHEQPAMDSTDVALTAEKLELTLANGKLLAIDNFDLAATVPEEALNRDVLRHLATTGKEIAVTSVSAQQGELKITGSGTVGIDSDGYPKGRIPTRISHPDLVFKIVENIAGLPEEELAAARTLVDLLQQNAAGSEPQLDLIAKDRKLYWGPFKLADLPPLF